MLVMDGHDYSASMPESVCSRRVAKDSTSTGLSARASAFSIASLIAEQRLSSQLDVNDHESDKINNSDDGEMDISESTQSSGKDHYFLNLTIMYVQNVTIADTLTYQRVIFNNLPCI